MARQVCADGIEYMHRFGTIGRERADNGYHQRMDRIEAWVREFTQVPVEDVRPTGAERTTCANMIVDLCAPCEELALP